jgi:hypothetical protein
MPVPLEQLEYFNERVFSQIDAYGGLDEIEKAVEINRDIIHCEGFPYNIRNVLWLQVDDTYHYALMTVMILGEEYYAYLVADLDEFNGNMELTVSKQIEDLDIGKRQRAYLGIRSHE